jgi:DDE superfamily endonuclease
MRPYLPESWVGDPERLDKAGVPGPSRQMKTKGQIALELLDRVRGEGLLGRVVVAAAVEVSAPPPPSTPLDTPSMVIGSSSSSRPSS